MEVYRPIKTNWISQQFGDNKPCAKTNKHGRAIRPFQIVGGQNDVPCFKGYIKFYPEIGLKGHNAMDMVAWDGEPLYFNVIADTEWYSLDASDTDGGLGVDVFSIRRIHIPELPPETGLEARKDWEANNHMIRVKFRFWHLSQAWKDTQVLLGEMIGRCGNTGASTGPHLHGPALKFVDDNFNTFDRYNGYFGCVDYTKIGAWNNTFILDKIKKEEVENTENIKELEVKIVEAELNLLELIKMLLTRLQIEVFKLRRGVGSFIN